MPWFLCSNSRCTARTVENSRTLQFFSICKHHIRLSLVSDSLSLQISYYSLERFSVRFLAIKT